MPILPGQEEIRACLKIHSRHWTPRFAVYLAESKNRSSLEFCLAYPLKTRYTKTSLVTHHGGI